MPSTASVIPMGSEKEAPSFVSQLAPKTYGLGQLDRLLLSAQSIESNEVNLRVGGDFEWGFGVELCARASKSATLTRPARTQMPLSDNAQRAPEPRAKVKKAYSAYVHWSLANRKKVKQGLPPKARLLDALQAAWAQLSAEEQRPWHKKALLDQKRYIEALGRQSA